MSKEKSKKTYDSPTTPGLKVYFRDYLIELVCLNVNAKLAPRFWSDKKYWGPKYRREIKGVSNLGKIFDITDTQIQTALIQIIRERNIKALVASKTVASVAKFTKKRIEELIENKKLLSKKEHKRVSDVKGNSTFVDTGNEGPLAKIRRIENG